LREPLKLLQVIKETCFSYQENEYPVAAYNMIMTQTKRMHHFGNESVAEYARRFETQWDVYEDAVKCEVNGLMVDTSKLTYSTKEEKRLETNEMIKAYRF
jgi:hypothetical protein